MSSVPFKTFQEMVREHCLKLSLHFNLLPIISTFFWSTFRIFHTLLKRSGLSFLNTQFACTLSDRMDQWTFKPL